MHDAVRTSPLEQTRFPEIVAARKIREHHFAARMRLRHFHKSHSHKIESVCGIALPADHLAGSEAQQLDVFSQAVDKFIRQTGKHRHGAKVAIESALAVGAVELRAETFCCAA